MKPIIYFDMDGVLTDFETFFNREFPGARLDKNGWAKHRDEWVKREGFLNLSPKQSGLFLLHNLLLRKKEQNFSLQILSSTGGADWFLASRQKTNWILNNGLYFCFDKLNFVNRGRDKGDKFASPNSILIDDTISVCDKFVLRGGQAVHFTGDAPDSLSKVLHQLEIINASVHETLQCM